MSLEQLKKDVCAAIDGMKAELLELSHSIHQEPELALQEFKSAEKLAKATEHHDLKVQRESYGLKTAYVSEFGDKGPNIAILSEYDALPGIGHACGHNIIATSGLGAALGLAKLNGRLPGRVRYLGTPAEERFGGKEIIAREGAFEKVDAAMMIHPANMNLMTMPCIAISEVEVTYHGRAAHAAAMPYRGINALDAVVQAYQAIAQLRQHIKNTERIHGIITEGGLAPNIVPERAGCRFYVRAVDVHELAHLKARVQACFEGAAIATGCKVETKWGASDYLDMKTNWAMAQAYEDNATALGREFFPMKDVPPGFAGSTDMGNVSHRVPSIHPMLAVAPSNVIIHNAEFAKWAGSDKGDLAVLDGAKSLAMTALDLMMTPRLLETAKKDFEATKELSRTALAALHDPVVDHVPHAHGCGVRRMNLWLLIAAINGALAVAFGAFGAHGLQGRIDAHALEVFETGARYHMYHALAMGLAALAAGSGAASAPASVAAGFFLAGIILFSGSLYLLALTGVRSLGFVTPFGGLAFLVGWIALAWAATKVA